MSDSEQAKDWREGFERIGDCPHCGVPIFVKSPQAGEPADLGPNGLPRPLYMCSCRDVALWSLKTGPFTWPNTPYVPSVPPWQSTPPTPWIPMSPAVPPTYPYVPFPHKYGEMIYTQPPSDYRVESVESVASEEIQANGSEAPKLPDGWGRGRGD